MEYRKSYPTDARFLVQLRNEVWKNTYYDVLPNGILQYMKENMEEMVNHLRDQIMENNRIIVALENNKIVGYIFYAKSQVDLYDTAERFPLFLIKFFSQPCQSPAKGV